LAGAWLLLTGRLLREAGQPRSSRAWSHSGGATRASLADAVPGARSTCHRDHPPDRRTAAHHAGLDAWHAGLARHTGILSGYARQ
jgi:hypothetical protein